MHRGLVGVCVSILLSTIGCLRTTITPREIAPEASRLAGINSRRISLSANCPAGVIVGHQYLFMFIPFGRVELADPSSMVLNTVFTKLALSGYQPTFEAGSPLSLRIDCTQLDLTAYDLIFFRRLSGTVALEGVLFDQALRPKRQGRGASSGGESRRFGFSPQLERAFRRELDEAVDVLLAELRLSHEIPVGK